MAGVIGVPCAETARWSSFSGCLAELERPRETKVIQARGASPAHNRNAIAAQALQLSAEWVFWLDDDMTFEPDALLRLLAHQEVSQKSVSIGLSLRRHPPFEPLWYRSLVPLEGVSWSVLKTTETSIPIEAGSSGGMLTRTDVFKTIERPWWAIGQFNPEHWHDDLYFCRQCIDAGFEIEGVPDVRFGHQTNIEVWPRQGPGESWSIQLSRSGQAFLLIPPPVPK